MNVIIVLQFVRVATAFVGPSRATTPRTIVWETSCIFPAIGNLEEFVRYCIGSIELNNNTLSHRDMNHRGEA